MVESRKMREERIEKVRNKYLAIAERDNDKEGEPKNSGGSLGIFFRAGHSLVVNGIHGCVVDRSAIRKQ